MAPPRAEVPVVEFCEIVLWFTVTAPEPEKMAPPPAAVPVVELTRIKLWLIVRIPAETDRTAPPLNVESLRLALLPVVLPFNSPMLFSVTSPAVAVMSKIRDNCCASMPVDPFPVIVTVSVIVSCPSNRLMVFPFVRTASNEIVSAPGLPFASAIASRSERSMTPKSLSNSSVIVLTASGPVKSS